MHSKSGHGPALVYLPGMEGTGSLFYRQQPSLAEHFTVFVCPFRSRAPFTYEELTADIKEIFDREGIDKATLVAESFGGTVALHFALRFPKHVSRLILINTFPYFRRRFRLRLARLLLPLAFLNVMNPIRKRILRSILISEKIDEEGINKLFVCSFSHGYAVSLQRLKLIGALDLRSQLAEIRVPVTLIAAQRDRVVPSIKEAQFMASRLADAKVQILPEYGHACLISSFQLATVLCDPEEGGLRRA